MTHYIRDDDGEFIPVDILDGNPENFIYVDLRDGVVKCGTKYVIHHL